MFKMTDKMMNKYLSNLDKREYRDIMADTIFPGLSHMREYLGVYGGLLYAEMISQKHRLHISSTFRQICKINKTFTGEECTLYNGFYIIYLNIMRPRLFYHVLEFVHDNIEYIINALDNIESSDKNRDTEFIIEEFEKSLHRIDKMYTEYTKNIRCRMYGEYTVYGKCDGNLIAPKIDLSFNSAIDHVMKTVIGSLPLNEHVFPENMADIYLKFATFDSFHDDYKTIKHIIHESYVIGNDIEQDLDEFEGPMTFAWKTEDSDHSVHQYEMKIIYQDESYYCL